MKTLLIATILLTATICSAQVDTLKTSVDTLKTYTTIPPEIVVQVDTTTPRKNGYAQAVKDSQTVAVREYARGFVAGQTSGYSSGYSVGYADGLAARPKDTVRVIVYMIPTDSMVYVNSKQFDAVGFVLPQGSQAITKSYSAGKVTLSYIYPKYKNP